MAAEEASRVLSSAKFVAVLGTWRRGVTTALIDSMMDLQHQWLDPLKVLLQHHVALMVVQVGRMLNKEPMTLVLAQVRSL